MKEVSTFEARIFLGLREGYEGPDHNIVEVQEVCHKYVSEVKLCVTVTPTSFVYPGANPAEPGVIIGLINYPRFPSQWYEIEDHARALARRLAQRFKQNRVSIMFPIHTVMLEHDEGDFECQPDQPTS